MATQGALAAADILMQGKKNLNLEIGRKNREGVAALIEDQTGLTDLKDAAQTVLANRKNGDLDGAINKLEAVLARLSS